MSEKRENLEISGAQNGEILGEISPELTIRIKNLRFFAIIGVMDYERAVPQMVRIDAKFRAAEFMDYAQISREFERIFVEQKFTTLEVACEFCCQHFKKQIWSLKRLNLQISKPQILPRLIPSVKIKKRF